MIFNIPSQPKLLVHQPALLGGISSHGTAVQFLTSQPKPFCDSHDSQQKKPH